MLYNRGCDEKSLQNARSFAGTLLAVHSILLNRLLMSSLGRTAVTHGSKDISGSKRR